MTNVYIVTSGSYSNYSIDGVFLDKASAETFCAVQNAKDMVFAPASIEVHSVSDGDVDKVTVVRGRWVAIGGVWPGVYGEICVLHTPKDDHGDPSAYGHRYFVASDGRRNGLARAKKIAGDRHAQWQAEIAGIA